MTVDLAYVYGDGPAQPLRVRSITMKANNRTLSVEVELDEAARRLAWDLYGLTITFGVTIRRDAQIYRALFYGRVTHVDDVMPSDRSQLTIKSAAPIAGFWLPR